jgi:two-component system, OmpR family, phosphate regulon response regulator OmpR
MSADDPAHVLIVDDDRRIRELLKSFLAANGLRVTAAANAAEARERMRGLAFDAAIVDVMMPGETGVAFTQSLRAAGNAMPVLMLSALGETDDRIAGLQAGSDDYLPKPFDPRELLLRLRLMLRRAPPVPAPGGEAEVRFGPCRFNVARGELRRDDEVVRLSARERDMLRTLVLKAGQPVSRSDLQGPGSEESARGVDVQVNRLRRKIEDNPALPVYLQTVRGAGYILHLD